MHGGSLIRRHAKHKGSGSLTLISTTTTKDHAPIFYLYSVETLKKALVLGHLLSTGGRLAFDENGRPDVDCNARALDLFSVARRMALLEGFCDFRPSPVDIEVKRIIRDVVPLNDANDDGEEGIKDEDPPILAFGAVELSSITAEPKLSPDISVSSMKSSDVVNSCICRLK
ncbi:hypothetical protein J5N97_027607 [Dioscorea zingiberensis]|uniref:Uncharacterized protein n=1 Tax=Dioscorea zingiberensis TaxID=325984 RepID=A0A9D5H7T0_9LILI|nr:hypothetical protein J5N97_027607 [Dioscorea zingiberensis]